MAKPSAKVIKPAVRYGCQTYIFDSIDQAANAVKFFSKLRPVEYHREDEDSRGHYRPVEDEDENRTKVELTTNFEFRERAKLLALPAPKRGTVQCLSCESVSVKPGRACGSCGAISPTAKPTTGREATN